MNYLIYHNNYPQSLDLIAKIDHFLSKHNLNKVTTKPDIVIAVGGDGTFLRAVNKYFKFNKQAIFIPINSGKIGFFSYCNLTNWEAKLTELFINNHLKQNIFQQPLLTIEHNQELFFALNEIRLIDNSHTISGQLFINDQLFEFFRGSGLALVSGIGSTGYGKSIGGSIIFSDAPVFQLLEIAPISHNDHRSIGAPIIISTNNYVLFKPKVLIKPNLVLDGINVNVKITNAVKISYGQEKLQIISNLKKNQMKYLREKLTINTEVEHK